MKDVKGGTDLADCVDVMSRRKGIMESLNPFSMLYVVDVIDVKDV